jgi:hypothetical protein
MLVSTFEAKNSSGSVLLDREVVCGSPTKAFANPARRNPPSAHRIRCPVLDYDHATRTRASKKGKEGCQHQDKSKAL